MSRKISLDRFDYGILEILQKDASITNKNLAKAIGLSPPATLVRVNHLKKNDYLLESSYSLNWQKLGYDYNVHLRCKIKVSDHVRFIELLDSSPRILSVRQIFATEKAEWSYHFSEFILVGIFKDQDEFNHLWDITVQITNVVVQLQFLKVSKEYLSPLPVPLKD